VAVRFSRSAARHGIAHERSRFVVEHCSCPLYSNDPGRVDLVVFLGPDARGVPLEVFGLELADGSLLVIHAMRLRASYRDDYEGVMRCQGW
jgi:hypothetical protein